MLIRREAEGRYQRGGWQACSKPWFGGTLGRAKRIEEEKEEIHVANGRPRMDKRAGDRHHG